MQHSNPPSAVGSKRQSGRSRRGSPAPSDAGDVGGKEVDAVSDEVAAGPVVMLGGSGVGVASKDLGIAERDAGIQALVIAA